MQLAFSLPESVKPVPELSFRQRVYLLEPFFPLFVYCNVCFKDVHVRSTVGVEIEDTETPKNGTGLWMNVCKTCVPKLFGYRRSTDHD